MAVVQSEGALVGVQRPGRPTMASSIVLHDGTSADYATLWRVQPNVRLVTGFLARNIAQLGLHAFDRVSDDERRRLAPSHPMSRLIRQPNPYVVRSAWWNHLVHDLKVFDRYYAWKLRNTETGQLNLFRIPPYMVTPIGSWYRPEAFEVKGSGTKVEIPADQVFELHGYNPSDQRVGSSPIEALRVILAEEAAAGAWREQYWKGAARVAGVLQRPNEAPKWSDTARERFRSDFQQVYAGQGVGAGSTPILEEGMEWKDASFSPKDSEYLASRRLGREEVAAQYFVSPLFVGILDHANFSNVSEQHKHLYQDTLGPDLVWFEEEWARQIVPEFSDLDQDVTYVEFNLAAKLAGTFTEQASVLQTLTGAPVMTRAEARGRLNLGPVDDPTANRLVLPLNVLLGGQASPTDSAPPLALGSGQAAGRPGGRKSLPAPVSGWQAKHVEVLGSFFDRQKAAVTSRLGAGQVVDEAWDDDRWNDELGTDLFALAATMAEDVAAPVAERFGGTYDGDLALAYLQESTRIAAENVNDATKAAVSEAHDPASTDDDPLAAVATVFAVAAASRAEQIATTRTTEVAGFASNEGARQSGAVSKVWLVNAANPRADHPSDGETVPIDGTFSNGARWPGDAGAGVSQTAGCTCSLDFTTEE